MRFLTKQIKIALCDQNTERFLSPLILDFRRILWYPCWLKGVISMARNRVILFGYCMKNGEITTEPKEVYAVEEILENI